MRLTLSRCCTLLICVKRIYKKKFQITNKLKKFTNWWYVLCTLHKYKLRSGIRWICWCRLRTGWHWSPHWSPPSSSHQPYLHTENKTTITLFICPVFLTERNMEPFSMIPDSSHFWLRLSKFSRWKNRGITLDPRRLTLRLTFLSFRKKKRSLFLYPVNSTLQTGPLTLYYRFDGFDWIDSRLENSTRFAYV